MIGFVLLCVCLSTADGDDIEAIKAFMGEDYTVSHVPLEARAVLNSFDDRAAHYEVIDRREQ